MTEAKSAFGALPVRSKEKAEAQYWIVTGFADSKQWPQVMSETAVMRENFPDSEWTPKAMIDAGMSARDQKRKAEESKLLAGAVAAYPNAIDVWLYGADPKAFNPGDACRGGSNPDRP